jgi:hypothetical protein
MEDLATKIQQRANDLNISVSTVCDMAGVSRDWFEKFKKRVPKSMQTYNKIDEKLRILENEKRVNKFI